MSNTNNTVPLNRAQRRQMDKLTKNKVTVVQEELDANGKEFIEYADEQKVDMNAFFRMFSFWMSLTTAQKEAVIVECIKQGKIDLEEKKDAGQNSESK